MPGKKRRSNKSSSKGFGFERQMCRLWSRWWTGGESDDIFWRTAGSGSRATARRRRGADDKWNHGDMKPDDPSGYELCSKWCFEFKFYQKYDIKGVLHHVSKQSDWMQWWAKIVDEAEAVGRAPILVTKQNAGKPIIWFHEDTWRVYGSAHANFPMIRLSITERDVKIDLKNKTKKTKTIHLLKHEVFGIALEEWFEWTDPETVRHIIKGQ